MAAGTGFGEDRGRVIVAANYLNSPDVIFANQRSWNHYRQLIDNPAYTATNSEPKFIHVDNVGLSQATTGGLITTGPLRGTQFVGPNATPTPFNFGIVSGPVSANGSAEILHPSINDLTVAYDSLSVFGYTSYKFADWLKASVQLNYGETNSRNNSVPAVRLGNLTIRNDNAYLPASVKAQMAAAGVTTVPFGTTNMNNINPDGSGYSLDSFANSLGIPVARTNRKLRRYVFSLEGGLGGGWTWNAYYQKGKVRVYQTTESNIISANYANAIDAVFAPAGNAAGIAAGTIVCRSTLTAPTNGCVPLNIFGNGVASQAAIDYVNVTKGQNFQIQRLSEGVVAASVQGKLPFGFAAGDIAVAAGAERRTERGLIENDAGAKARIYSVGNFPSFFGKYNVKEAFAEVDVPILKDAFVDSLSFNAAARVTDYSTSGKVTTWKLGFVSQLNSDLRVRGTVSRDIRAPNLNELFSTGLSTLGSAVDPKTGANVSIFTFASGNPALTPEVAKTYSGGVVLRPSWLSRFTASIDYYNIDLKDAISSIGAAEVLSRCNAGQTVFCPQLVFGGPNGVLSQINTFPQNVASLKTSGIDVQTDYSFPLGNGNVALRALGNYILVLSQDQLGVTVKYAGAIGPDNPVSGFPRARATVSATWSNDTLSGTIQGRFIGASKLVANWTAKDVDDNTVPAIFYVDLRGQYEIMKGIQIFGTVDNLFNIDPPNVAATPSRGQTAYYFTPVRGDIHDTLGRSYRVGARFRF
jgi:outer membrane receptor protein involved in Fe transport